MGSKRKTILSVAGVVISTALLIASAFLTENGQLSPMIATLMMIISVILVFVAIFFAAKVEYEASVYECRKCGNVFKPTLKAYIMASHTLTKRYLKCTECDKKSWCTRKSAQ